MEGLIVWVALSNVVGVLIESPVIRQNFSRYVRACKGPKSRAERQEENIVWYRGMIKLSAALVRTGNSPVYLNAHRVTGRSVIQHLYTDDRWRGRDRRETPGTHRNYPRIIQNYTRNTTDLAPD